MIHFSGPEFPGRILQEKRCRFGMSTFGPVDAKKKDNVTNETWLFVDGNWWRQYIDYMIDFTFAKF
jgi:hypothetical protein